MRKITTLAAAVVLLVISSSAAQAQEGETFETLKPIYNVVMVQVHPNMGENYINNLRKTWLVGTEEAMKEGIVEDYQILTSLTPNDEGVNLIIITKHADLASMDVSSAWRDRADRIRERVLQRISEQETDEITGNVYPSIRTIVGEKMMRRIKFIGG